MTYIFLPFNVLTIIGWGFCDIQNNQGRGPKAKAEADNPYRDLNHDFLICP